MEVISLLECGHYVTYPRVWADMLNAYEWCPQCERYKDVSEQWASAWHSVCKTCGYQRSHGYAKKYAETAASRHANRTGHAVTLQWRPTAPTEARAAVAGHAKTRGKSVAEAMKNEPFPF
jgi:hypothetical protein